MFRIELPESTPIDETTLPPQDDALPAGLEWLYATTQPNIAICMHHGAGIHTRGNRYFRFIPRSFRRGLPVVAIEVRDKHRNARLDITNPLEPGETDQLAARLTDLGTTIVDRWNGEEGMTTVSFELKRPAHPSLLAAVDRYHAGCPIHDTVFCGQKNDCDWYPKGYTNLHLPTITPCAPRTP